MDVSLIVATLNRKDDLERLLHSVEVAAARCDVAYEVVIVDNGSSDGTGAVCEKWVALDNDKYRYLVEPRRGKSIALNTGLRSARGPIIAFTDDDCLVQPDWLERLTEEFSADDDLSVLGGRVESYDRSDPPLTLATHAERVILTSPKMLYPTPLVIGGNLAARRDLFASIGGFDETMGPGTLAAEDVDLLLRALRKGFKIAYSPSVVIYHNHGRLRAERVAVEEITHTYQVGRGALYVKHALRGDREIVRMFAADLWEGLNRSVGRGVDGPTTSYLRGLLVGAGIRSLHEIRLLVSGARRRKPIASGDPSDRLPPT